MPEISGIVLSSMIRLELGSTIPIIAMSSQDHCKEEVMCHANAFLKKPITKLELEMSINSAIQQKVVEVKACSIRNTFSRGINQFFSNKVGISYESESLDTKGISGNVFDNPMRAILIDDSHVCLKMLGQMISNIGNPNFTHLNLKL